MTAMYAVAFLAIYAVNVLPALAPPTWAVLIALALTFDLRLAWLVPIGASAATLGRVTLAYGAKRFRHRLSPQRLQSLESLKRVLRRGQRRTWAGVLLFLVSPLPSNQLFIAAGLMAMPLRALVLAFLLGRLVTYTLYLQGAVLVRRNFGDLWLREFTSPQAIVLQVVALGAVAALLLIDWAPVVQRFMGQDEDDDDSDDAHRIEV